jgi:hypothetical protein
MRCGGVKVVNENMERPKVLQDAGRKSSSYCQKSFATVESEGSETENRNLNKPPIHLRHKTETKTSLLTAGLGESYYKCKHINTNGGEILKKKKKKKNIFTLGNEIHFTKT